MDMETENKNKKTIMRVIKDKNNPYVQINKTCLNDERLSWKAKGLFAYMLSLPDNWIIYQCELVNHARDGIDSVRAIMKELKKFGYLNIYQERNEDGTFGSWVTCIFEHPSLNQSLEDLPKTDFPTSVNPISVSPTSVNPKLLINENTNKLKKEKLINKETKEKESLAPPRSAHPVEKRTSAPPEPSVDLTVDLSLSSQKSVSKINRSEVQSIFDYWQEVMKHENAKLDSKRSRTIQSALKMGYRHDELCRAILGCSLTPFNMGDNDRGQTYDGLHVIFRDAEQIERFMRHADRPPKPMGASEKRTQGNINAIQRLGEKKRKEAEQNAAV